MQTSTGLAIVDALPDGFLDCSARDLHLILNGPTLIELAGERDPPLFVSILLHGNEISGLGALQDVLRGCRDLLPRSLMLFVGNVEAARYGLRRIDGQPDYNRIWPGAASECETLEGRIVAEVHARVVAQRAVAAIDFHNNSGRNPHYSVVCSLDPRTLELASLFSRRAVCFRGVPGTQTASFANLIPAITAECGQPGVPANAQAGARFLKAALRLDGLRDIANAASALDLYHTLGVVRVREEVSLSFGPGDAELHFDPGLDEYNFRELAAGTVLGETSHPMPLRMIDEAGRDVAEAYFETRRGKLKLRKPAVPAMLTVEAHAVRQDCLCYLMERLEGGG